MTIKPSTSAWWISAQSSTTLQSALGYGTCEIKHIWLSPWRGKVVRWRDRSEAVRGNSVWRGADRPVVGSGEKPE